MNKTVTLITGGIVTVTLSIFLILGKIDLTTFGTLTSAILGVIYGFYQKIENKELIETVELFKDNEIGYKYTIENLQKDNNFLSRNLDSQKNINKNLEQDLDLALKVKNKTIKSKSILQTKLK